jgi:hypothetical protein
MHGDRVAGDFFMKSPLVSLTMDAHAPTCAETLGYTPLLK